MLIIKAYNSIYISLLFSKQFSKTFLGSKYTRQLVIKVNFKSIISVMKTLHLRWKTNRRVLAYSRNLHLFIKSSFLCQYNFKITTLDNEKLTRQAVFSCKLQNSQVNFAKPFGHWLVSLNKDHYGGEWTQALWFSDKGSSMTQWTCPKSRSWPFFALC